MNESNSSGRDGPGVILACALCISLLVLPVYAESGSAIGAPLTRNLEVGGEGLDSETIDITVPEDFIWNLNVGENNETTKSVLISVTEYDGEVYLKVHDANYPAAGTAGYMFSPTADDEKGADLENPVWVGERDTPSSMVALSDSKQTIYTFTETPGDVTVYLDFGQMIECYDEVKGDYAITVTFTGTPVA